MRFDHVEASSARLSRGTFTYGEKQPTLRVLLQDWETRSTLL
jgi:hypothetical protein